MKNNFSEYISSHAIENGNDIFCSELNGNSITYKEFDDRINQCCRHLKSLELAHDQKYDVVDGTCVSQAKGMLWN